METFTRIASTPMTKENAAKVVTAQGVLMAANRLSAEVFIALRTMDDAQQYHLIDTIATSGAKTAHDAFTWVRENQYCLGLDDSNQRAYAHYAKFLRYAELFNVSFVGSGRIKSVIKALRKGDPHLKTIALNYWDGYHGYYLPIAQRHGITTWSLSDSVCLAKCSARRDALAVMQGKPIKTAEDMHRAMLAVGAIK